MSIIIGRAMGPMGGGGTDGWVPEFDLWDDFTTAEAAPLASPRTTEPGGGTLTLVQTDGEFSIANGALAFPAQTTAAWGDQGFYGAAVTRADGVALLCLLNLSTWELAGVGWHGSAAVADPDNFAHSLQANTTDGQIDNAHGALVYSGLAAATDYALAQVLGTTRTKQFIRVGSDWDLAWVATATTTPVYAAFSNYSGVGTLDTFRVLDLPAPFNTDYGLATNRIAGAVSGGATFTHEANCLIEWVQTTLSSTTSYVLFRTQSAGNAWQIGVSSTGELFLREQVGGGAAVVRASAAGVVSNGHRIVIIADGTTIRGYSNNVLRWTYSSATNFATATAGELNTLGVGGAVSDVVSWPRVLSGQAKTLLDAAIDA